MIRRLRHWQSFFQLFSSDPSEFRPLATGKRERRTGLGCGRKGGGVGAGRGLPAEAFDGVGVAKEQS